MKRMAESRMHNGNVILEKRFNLFAWRRCGSALRLWWWWPCAVYALCILTVPWCLCSVPVFFSSSHSASHSFHSFYPPLVPLASSYSHSHALSLSLSLSCPSSYSSRSGCAGCCSRTRPSLLLLKLLLLLLLILRLRLVARVSSYFILPSHSMRFPRIWLTSPFRASTWCWMPVTIWTSDRQGAATLLLPVSRIRFKRLFIYYHYFAASASFRVPRLRMHLPARHTWHTRTSSLTHCTLLSFSFHRIFRLIIRRAKCHGYVRWWRRRTRIITQSSWRATTGRRVKTALTTTITTTSLWSLNRIRKKCETMRMMWRRELQTMPVILTRNTFPSRHHLPLFTAWPPLTMRKRKKRMETQMKTHPANGRKRIGKRSHR